MTLPAPRKLDQYVTTETGPLRTTLLWTRVSKRMGARRAPVRGWHAAAFAAAVAAAILLVVHHEHRTGIAPAAPTTQSTDSVGVTTLADGSRVRARPGGHVRIDRVAPTAVEVTLESGAADFDVVHDAARTFVVHTGRFDVSDLGTRFSVSIDGGLRVSVSEGRVEIRDTTGALPVRILARGESWSASTEPDPAPSGATAEATAAATASASRPLTAKELMEQADAARVAGRAREAAASIRPPCGASTGPIRARRWQPSSSDGCGSTRSTTRRGQSRLSTTRWRSARLRPFGRTPSLGASRPSTARETRAAAKLVTPTSRGIQLVST